MAASWEYPHRRLYIDVRAILAPDEPVSIVELAGLETSY
jgi:hypothetical protein